MAVKQCLECGGEVEKWERTCPHCGSTQKPQITRLLLAAILIGAGFVAWPFLFPETRKARFQPGTPALSRPESPVCVTADLLSTYLQFSAKSNQASMDNLLASGCVILGENTPMTILETDTTGLALVQGYYDGRATNFWISQDDLKPYQTK
jgi:hypothetical protein